jgi:hypothetical protein
VSFTIDPAEVQEFVAAQAQLRAQVGTIASFGVPTVAQWPAGTPINPDTNEPYDATIVAVNAPYAITNIVVLVIAKKGSPLRPGADLYFTQSGSRLGMDIILDVDAGDYDTVIAGASMFTVEGIEFSIEEAKPFTLAGTIYRWLVYGAAR